MLASIHLRKGITAHTARIAIALCVIACSALGAFLPYSPYITTGASTAAACFIALGLFRGALPVRLAFVLLSCAFGAVSAWFLYVIDRMPPEAIGSPGDAAGIVCRFLVWLSALAGSFAVARAVYSAGAEPAGTKRAVFRFLLYLECFVIALLFAAMDRNRAVLPAGLLISTGLFLLGYVGVAIGYRRHVQLNAEDQLRAEELQKELEKQKEQFDALSGRLSVLRRAKHDLSNHLTIVASLLRDGQRNKARDYVRALSENLRSRRGSSPIAISLLRTRTGTLEERGVRIKYPDVRELSAAERALCWPWTERIVEIAEHVLQNMPAASLEIRYSREPLVVEAYLAPADKESVRSSLIDGLRDPSGGTILLAEDVSAQTVRLAVLIGLEYARQIED